MKKNDDNDLQEDLINEAESRPEDDQPLAEDESEEVARLEEKLAEMENQAKRALADYQNLQRRVLEEKNAWIRAANKNLLLNLLPVLDTLTLAYKNVEEKGLKISIQLFEDALKSEGVTKIETKGKDFDPHIMEAVSQGNGEAGKVIDEVRPGYMLYDKLLRPAQVIVGGEKE